MAWRRPRKRTLFLLALAGFVALSAACAVSRVTPPPPPKDPVSVWLVKEALHKGLVLPGEAGEWLEYGYGEWGWYAEGHDAWYDVFDTLLWPTAGTLGRRVVRARDEAALRDAYRYAELARIEVERPRMEALRAELAARFEKGGEPLYNRRYDMYFVRDFDGFWLFHSCSDAVAVWLRALGCEVSWAIVRVGLTL